MLKFDDVLAYVGEFGPYQKLRYFLLCLTCLVVAQSFLAQVFLAAETDHWCYAPELSYYQTNCTDAQDVCLQAVKHFTLPLEASSDSCGKSLVHSNCYRYDITGIDFYPGKDITRYTNTTKKCDHGWRYDRSQYKSTVFQQFDLVCDRYYLGALSSSMYMAGVLIGSVVFGAVADKIGRSPTFLMAVLGASVAGTACAFSPNIIAYSAFRFIIGATAYGYYIVAYVIGTEIVGPSKRAFAGIAILLFFSFGYMTVDALAYFIRYWWILQLVISVPTILFVSYWWIIPESPRWLLTTGRIEKAEEVIRKFAKGNGTHVPESIFEKLKQGEEKMLKTDEETASVIDLFRHPQMRKKLLIITYTWFTDGLVYYGLSLNTSNLGGDDYINALISASVEIPAYMLGLYMPGTILGRRWSMFITQIIGGAACILTLITPVCETKWIGIALAIFGKLCITAAFGMMHLFSVEIYPTPVRTIGMGLSSMCARIGGVLAPQMILIGQLWEPLPIIIFGATSILAGILVLLLPETRNKQLPETIGEGEQFGTRKTERQIEEKGHTSEVDVGTEKRFLVKQLKYENTNNGIDNPTQDMSFDRSVGIQTTDL